MLDHFESGFAFVDKWEVCLLSHSMVGFCCLCFHSQMERTFCALHKGFLKQKWKRILLDTSTKKDKSKCKIRIFVAFELLLEMRIRNQGTNVSCFQINQSPGINPDLMTMKIHDQVSKPACIVIMLGNRPPAYVFQKCYEQAELPRFLDDFRCKLKRWIGQCFQSFKILKSVQNTSIYNGAK